MPKYDEHKSFMRKFKVEKQEKEEVTQSFKSRDKLDEVVDSFYAKSVIDQD